MSSITGSRPDVYRALEIANGILALRSIVVSSVTDEIRPKEPISLQITNSETGKTRNIGITHVVHLKEPDWDSQPFEKIARTTEQVASAIIDRIFLFYFAEAQGHHIHKNGTIFDFGQVAVELFDDGTFTVNKNLVTYAGHAILLSNFKSEGIITFRPLPSGDICLSDDSDHREGKGMFIDPKGEIYRA